MSAFEKAEKAIDFFKHLHDDNKLSDIQHHAGMLGQYMGAIGNHSSMVAKFSVLLPETIPVLLNLCSHQRAELRLVGDETLNRVVVGGSPFHASKVHLNLHNNIIATKNPRWLKAVLSRICLGRGWLRAGGGRGRLFAQATIQRLREILDSLVVKGDAMLMECLEANLPRIMRALSPFATKEEMFGLLTSFMNHIESQSPPIRRSAASCLAELCLYHQKKFIMHIVNAAIDALTYESAAQHTVLGWFGVLRALFYTSPLSGLPQDIMPIEKCLQIYWICLQYIDSKSSDHNIQNASMECLNILLSDPNPGFRSALLDQNGPVSLVAAVNEKHKGKWHHRSFSSVSMVQSVISKASSSVNLNEPEEMLLSEQSDFPQFYGTLMFSSVSQQQTPYRSMEDLSTREMNTPDSPCSSMMNDSIHPEMTPEQFTSYVNEKFSETLTEKEADNVDNAQRNDEQDDQESVKSNHNFKSNIGTFFDTDVPLKYCARLLVSRFLLSGYSGQTISDRSVRVSVKSLAISCLSSIVNMYPECLALYLDKDVDLHNLSGNSDFSNISHNEMLNDFVLERNICYQESMTDSFGQELLTKSIDLMSQVSNAGSNNSGMSQKMSSSARREKFKAIVQESVDNSSLAGIPSNMLDSRQQSTAQNTNQMGASYMSGDSANLAMTNSNFTLGSNMTMSRDQQSTDYLMTSSVDPLTSSMELEMKFDYFGESSNSLEAPLNFAEMDLKNIAKSEIEQKFQDMFLRNDGNTIIERQISNESKSSIKSDEVDDGKLSSKEPPVRKHSSERGVMNQDQVLETVEENSKIDGVESTPSLKEVDKNVISKPVVQIANGSLNNSNENDAGPQHISEIFVLMKDHPDPQIKGLIRVCIGVFLNSVIHSASGDYGKWKPFSTLSKDVADKMQLAMLVKIILEGLADDIHSCVNNSLTALGKCIQTLSMSNQISVIPSIMNSLRCVENNPYWLCKVNLCKFYEKLPYQRFSVIVPDWSKRSVLILDIMFKLLSDQDQRVRKASTEAITRVLPIILPSAQDINKLITNLANSHTESLLFIKSKADVNLLKDFMNAFVLSDLPGSLKKLHTEYDKVNINGDMLQENLKTIVASLYFKLIETSCKFLTQGCLETLLEISLQYPATKYPDAYVHLGLLDTCLQLLDSRTLPVACCETLLALATEIYAITALKVIQNTHYRFTSFPKDTTKKLWVHFGDEKFSQRAESFLKITLKMLNIIIHIVEDVTPVAFQQKTTSIIPPSPIRRSGEHAKRNNNAWNSGEATLPDDKGTSKKKAPFNSTNGHFNPIGYFANDAVLMKLYGNLKAAYSSHKVTLDSSTSVFLKFVSTTLKCVAMQLEYMSDKEAGVVAEEILFYIKCLLPMNSDNSVFCVTQILKCLSTTNLVAYHKDVMDLFELEDPVVESQSKKVNLKNDLSFYSDILMINYNDKCDNYETYCDNFSTDRRGSADSRTSKTSNVKINFYNENYLTSERQCYKDVIKISQSKVDRRWNTNKQDLGRYLRLIEPVVIQALKSYTIQNNTSLQCRVLELLNQLLALRVNYFLLDSDQVFIGFVLKQLKNIENQEILDCGELVRCIFTFLVHLSSIKHHTKQLMDIPKLIQLCDSLMASGVHRECVESLHPVSYRVFLSNRAQGQEGQVAKEVLFAMQHKIMHDPEVIKLISSILVFSEEHPESHFRWSQLAMDSMLQLLKQGCVDIDSADSYSTLETLFDCLHPEVIHEQGRIESVVKIMCEKPPDQENATMEAKQRWLATVLLFLRKVIPKYTENKVLSSLNSLKAADISPCAIFFNMEDQIDPLNVQTVNENCANLQPDVILVRFMFRVLTYALFEMRNCDKSHFKEVESSNKSMGNMTYWCSLTSSLLCQVKHILYLKDGCQFPLLAKTAQSVLQNELSGLNTGLYSPEENIPLLQLSAICDKLLWWQPLLTVHWCHLLVRLKFLEQKYWNTLFGFLQHSSVQIENNPNRNVNSEILQIGCFLTLCEHFVDNGLEEVIYLTWLLVNRIHLLVRYSDERVVIDLVDKVNANPSASGLMLQAIAARCHHYIQGSFGVKIYRILSGCHVSQTGSLVLFICRVIGSLQASNSVLFAKLAVSRCRYLVALSVDNINLQLTKEDLQIALETLQREKVHFRHPQLIQEVNMLASTFFDLSPLDLSQHRPINAQYVKTTSVHTAWLVSQIKNRCYQNLNEHYIFGKYTSLAKLLSSLNLEQLNSIVNCPEFDRHILTKMLPLGTDNYIKKLLQASSEWEERANKSLNLIAEEKRTSNKTDNSSHFYISVKNNEVKETNEIIDTFDAPELEPLLTVSLSNFERTIQTIVSLFPRQSRPLSQFETGNFSDNHSMDKYTRRCFQVFRDKVFHQELVNSQNLVTSYLESLKNLENKIQYVESSVKEKVLDLFLSKTLSKILMSFTVISLQYTLYLIKLYEHDLPADCESSYRTIGLKTCEHNLDNTLNICVVNASKCFNLQPVWKVLNVETNTSRVHSAINCLYAFVKYSVKDTLPLNFVNLATPKNCKSDPGELPTICDKFLTLIKFWEDNIYNKLKIRRNCFMSYRMQIAVEKLLIALCRCEFANSFTLVPPLAWCEMDIFEDVTKPTICDLQNSEQPINKAGLPVERILKKEIAIPIHSLQDMDVLEQFLFRVNLIGWTSKKGFEEIWMSLLGALQGNGTHWAMRGIMQLLLSTNTVKCTGERERTYPPGTDPNRIQSVLLDCKLLDGFYSDINVKMDFFVEPTYNYSNLSIEYLSHAAGVNENADVKTQNALKQARKNLQDLGIDINSCLQLLMDFASQMSSSQFQWGVGARLSMLCCLVNVCDTFSFVEQWKWLEEQLLSIPSSADTKDMFTQQYLTLGMAKVKCVLEHAKVFYNTLVYGKDLETLPSNRPSNAHSPFHPTKVHAVVLRLRTLRDLHSKKMVNNSPEIQAIFSDFNVCGLSYVLDSSCLQSPYEKSQWWNVLFLLVDFGRVILLRMAVVFLLDNPEDIWFEIVLRGVCNAVNSNANLSCEIRDNIFEKIKTDPYLWQKFCPLLMMLVYSGDVPSSDEIILEPDKLYRYTQIVTCLQKAALTSVSTFTHSPPILRALRSFIKDFLPPHTVVNNVTLKFLDCCSWADSCCMDGDSRRNKFDLHVTPYLAEMTAQIVFDVFESSGHLSILSGWLFDILQQVLQGRVPSQLTPHILLCLIVCSSDNPSIRLLAPSIFHTLRASFYTTHRVTLRNTQSSQILTNSVGSSSSMKIEDLNGGLAPKLSFSDRRILCLGAVHSGYTQIQIDQLKAVCCDNDALSDLLSCLE